MDDLGMGVCFKKIFDVPPRSGAGSPAPTGLGAKSHHVLAAMLDYLNTPIRSTGY